MGSLRWVDRSVKIKCGYCSLSSFRQQTRYSLLWLLKLLSSSFLAQFPFDYRYILIVNWRIFTIHVYSFTGMFLMLEIAATLFPLEISKETYRKGESRQREGKFQLSICSSIICVNNLNMWTLSFFDSIVNIFHFYS